jgi:hypothetical protein
VDGIPTWEPNELVELDPDSGAIIGRLALPADPSSIAAGETALWVRLFDQLVQVEPSQEPR